MVEKIRKENIFLVNSPAGSGKTTKIKQMINKFLLTNPNDNILCITYTNRAVEELSKDNTSKNIYIETIHSFLNTTMGIYFKSEEVINLYFEKYANSIIQRISSDDDKYIESNEKYVEKFGELTFETVKRNINEIIYNESQFMSLLYGGLSHDELLFFSKKILDKYPIIKKRISSKFQYIFIDEYQDTSAEVLKLFFESVQDTNSKLYYFGDKMQQIYKNYDGSFEENFKVCDSSIKLETNYRSSDKIVGLLNNIYNDKQFNQNINKESNFKSDFKPRVIITDKKGEKIGKIEKEYPNILMLWLINREKFEALGAGNLFCKLSEIDEYKFGQQYTAVDILSDNSFQNPDILFKVLFRLAELDSYQKENKIGLIIRKIKESKAVFNSDEYKIYKHEDKIIVKEKLKVILEHYNDSENTSINELLECLKENKLIRLNTYDKIHEDKVYSELINVPLKEFKNVVDFIENPRISTQHGVKGESHNEVIFIADDNSNIQVKMYDFFNLWSNASISFANFQSFYYDYSKIIRTIEEDMGTKVSNLNKNVFKEHKETLLKKAEEIRQRFCENDIFINLCDSKYSEFLEKNNVTSAKKCFKDSTVYGVLSAYKLFYVGCSRARKNLIILLEKNKIKGSIDNLEQKLTWAGFDVMKDF